jgi:ribosomal protein S18 acetylase RimI-like enzyme
MSLWAEYLTEREGKVVIEEEFGFIAYRIPSNGICIVDAIYVSKETRRSGFGSALCDRVAKIAIEAECTQLWSQVQVNTFNATDSLKACLAYGFRLHSLDGTCIVLIKDIVGE